MASSQKRWLGEVLGSVSQEGDSIIRDLCSTPDFLRWTLMGVFRQSEMGSTVAFLTEWRDWDGRVQTLTEGPGSSGCVSLCLCSQHNCVLFQQDQLPTGALRTYLVHSQQR